MINEELENEIEYKLAFVLASVYMRIPWSKIGVKSAHKFFVDRIRSSSNSRNFKEFMDIFTRKCNVEFIKIDTDIMNFLDEHLDVTLMLLRKESVFIANYALEVVELKKNKGK